MNKKFLAIAITLFTVFSFLSAGEVKAGAEHNVSGFAWSENIGWISFNSLNCDPDNNGQSNGGAGCPTVGTVIQSYGVNVDLAGNFSGNAWSENIGWISFDNTRISVPPKNPLNAAQLNWGTGVVSGWARVLAACQNNLWDSVNKKCTGSGAGDASGGWDGWIKMKKYSTDSGADYGVYFNASTGHFYGWAWGSDVVSWVSFNRINCDSNEDGVSDNPQCAAGPVSNYKVLLVNRAPTASNLSVNFISYCGLSNPPAILSWTYSDLDGDSQSVYQIEIDNDSNLDFDPLDITPPRGCPFAGSTKEINLGQECVPVNLSYNTIYYWRLKVWDSKDLASVWYYPPSSITMPGTSFSTKPHQYPVISFTHSPLVPSAKETVTFTDTSTCYNIGGGDYPCNTNASNRYVWNFGDGTPLCDSDITPSCRGTVKHSYNSAAINIVTLQITDNVGTCSDDGDTPFRVRVPLPKFREILPVSIIRSFFAGLDSLLNSIGS